MKVCITVCGFVCLVLGAFAAYAVPTDEECLFCHGEANMTGQTTDGKTRSLYVSKDLFEASMHKGLGCVGCHSEIQEVPHAAEVKPVDCGSCHEQAAAYAKSLHAKALARGDKDAAGCQDCHGKHDIRAVKDPLSAVFSRNLPDTCGRCHSDPALPKNHMIAMVDPSASYRQSIHGRALLGKGNLEAATCTSCHGAHDLLRSTDPESKVYRFNLSKTCGQCHKVEVAEFAESIHGKALAAGLKDTPTCADCHGEHDILEPSNVESFVSKQKGAEETCSRCHDNERLMKRYGITVARSSTYMDSFHRIASAKNANAMATCSSCHGTHSILAASDPKSSVNKDNLPTTCGKCHENAGPNFAVGMVHTVPSGFEQKAKEIVRLVYLVLIFGTIGGMLLHNILHIIRRLIERYRHQRRSEDTYTRFSLSMRLGHLLLFLSFTTLAVSGFALPYKDSWWAQLIFPGPAGQEVRLVIHRVAALVLVGLAVWNGLYLILTRSGRKELAALMFRPRDIVEAFKSVAYLVGLSKKHPRYDRYTYVEKAEYWGMWWGTAVMVITGFCMWFMNTFLTFLPKLVLDICDLIHFYEAVLAVLTILVWHFYFTIFDPKVYPMNWSWITGRLTVNELKEHHPLEYEREYLSEQDDAPNTKAL